MQHVVVDPLHHVLVLLAEADEAGALVRPVDLLQLPEEVEFDASALHHLQQRPLIPGYGEELGPTAPVLDVHVLQHACATPVVRSEVHDLVRRAPALHHGVRTVEDRPALAESLDQLPGVRRMLEAVIGGDAVAPQRFRQALHRRPVELDAGAHEQLVVSDPITLRKRHGVLFGQEGGRAVLDPGGTLGDVVLLLALRVSDVERPPAHQGPCGLVVVLGGRLDDAHAEAGIAPEQQCGRGKAGVAAAHHEDLEVLCHLRVVWTTKERDPTRIAGEDRHRTLVGRGGARSSRITDERQVRPHRPPIGLPIARMLRPR